MTAEEHSLLRREASSLKMRAIRLRSLGDEQDQWDAILHFREAARKELAAMSKVEQLSEREETGARIEACGLYLEAQDPVRASLEWAQLPRWAFTSESGSAMLERLMPLYTEEIAAFSEAWRKLQPNPGKAPNIKSPSIKQLRALATRHPGVAELWWALSRREPSTEKSQVAFDRMIQLDSTLEDSKVAATAWERVERAVARRIRLALHTEQRGNALVLSLVSHIQSAFGDVLDSFTERVFGDSVQLIPQEATPGSFILNMSAQGLHPHALEELDRELTSHPERFKGRKLVELTELLSQNGISLTVSAIDTSDDESKGIAPALTIDRQRGKVLLKAAETSALRAIDSVDIPQADDLSRVFLIVEMIANHSVVSSEALSITARQVAYYYRAGKILGLIAESNELTSAGRLVARLDPEDRLRTTVVYFESCTCGDAWIRWSGGKTLLNVDPEAAARFILESVPDLAPNTAHRRAKTLSAWHRALINYHYAL